MRHGWWTRRYWSAIAEAAGLPDGMTFYDLRHFHASWHAARLGQPGALTIAELSEAGPRVDADDPGPLCPRGAGRRQAEGERGHVRGRAGRDPAAGAGDVNRAHVSALRRSVLHVLPSARRRQQETAAREAAGESLWTTDFDVRACVRIASAWSAFEQAASESYGPEVRNVIANHLRQEGGWGLTGGVDPEDFTRKIALDLRLDMLATVPLALDFVKRGYNYGDQFMNDANAIMREHRIAHKFVEGELIPFESDELLQEVVEPTLRLLVGDQFKDAHASYLDALKEISDGKPDDAITDAGRALQQALTALGCEGDVLSKLIADAKQKNLFRSHDQQLHEAFILIAKWTASERNNVGDTHKDGGATVADAWFIVHVVGALIVRLADPSPRGPTP